MCKQCLDSATAAIRRDRALDADPPPPPRPGNWLESGRESAYGPLLRPPPPPVVSASCGCPDVCTVTGLGLRFMGEGRGGGRGHGCIRREGTSEAAPEAVRPAVAGGCQSGWGAVTVGYKCH